MGIGYARFRGEGVWKRMRLLHTHVNYRKDPVDRYGTSYTYTIL